MRLLLDTHVAIWAISAPERIPEHLRQRFDQAYPNIFVSAVAVWEIAIKHPLGRPDAPPVSAHQAIVEFEGAGLTVLDVTAAHAAFVERLPLHHGDPFDRLMLAQAMVENLQFVTFDRQLTRYGAPILTWS